jgi:PAS domain-containing protein
VRGHPARRQHARLDGYATAELIRRRERSRHIPIMFVSAIDKDDEHIARAYAMGAVDYVFKPVDPVILRSKIAVLVDLYLKNEEVRRQAQLERLLQEENLRIRQEKLEAERQLRQIEERQTAIVRSLADRVVQRATEGPLLRAALRQRGHGASDRLPGRALRRRSGPVARAHPSRGSRARARRCRCDPDERRHVRRVSVVCADGSHRWFLDRAVLIRDHDGHPQEIFGSCLDITIARRSSSSCSRRRRWKPSDS